MAIVLIGCTADPRKYQGLRSSEQLAEQKKGDFKYEYISPDFNAATYNSAIVDPVEIYNGDDNQFGSVSQKDRTYLADYINKVFPKTISKQYTLTTEPGPNTLRIHITLTGIKKSTPVLSTLSHASSFGLVTNGVLQAVGENGTAYGAVYYAVEIFDSQSSRLLYAHVTVQTPDALDVTASFGYLDAAREGVRIGAQHLVRKLNKLSKQAPKTSVIEKTGTIGK
ncbi:DUF3313 domain-containing protein [Acidomonas methanolica]|uniref:DUF3313 domain-containing protein n=1 Tax=Acidomonas methanolica TaxID=437 RepID=UPI00211A676D|nr:DUF3313 domain-containing protein [Acidomonas methanolica]MCQ9156853.1 DUF3313 domain-containing protein [Acidomonas methanolica]